MNLSVIVCTFNRCESLRRMLNSLREAVIPPSFSWEIIIVDNNSNDDTRSVFKDFEKQFETTIRYLYEKKSGISYARNRGIREAKGEIVAFTDDDVLVDSHWPSNVYNAFKKHDDTASVGGKILPIWESPRPKWLNAKWHSYLALLDYGDSTAYMKQPNIWGANFAVKSAIFKKYGFFDENLGRVPKKLYGAEETEFLQRIMSSGEKILYYPLAVIYHFVPSYRMSKKYLRKWRFDQGELEGFLKGNSKYLNLMNTHSLTYLQIARSIITSTIKRACCTKNSFDNELRICYMLGFLSGRKKRLSNY